MLTQDEVERVNSGEHIVVYTHRPRCNETTTDCHISLWSPPHVDCHFKVSNRLLREGRTHQIVQRSVYTGPSKHSQIAKHRKLIHYSVITGKFTKTSIHIEMNCDKPIGHPPTLLTNFYRSLTLSTLYCKLTEAHLPYSSKIPV